MNIFGLLEILSFYESTIRFCVPNSFVRQKKIKSQTLQQSLEDQILGNIEWHAMMKSFAWNENYGNARMEKYDCSSIINRNAQK